MLLKRLVHSFSGIAALEQSKLIRYTSRRPLQEYGTGLKPVLTHVANRFHIWFRRPLQRIASRSSPLGGTDIQPRVLIAFGGSPHRSATLLRRNERPSHTARNWFGFIVILAVWISGAVGCERTPVADPSWVGMFGTLGLVPGSFNYPRGIASEGYVPIRAVAVHRNKIQENSVFVVDKSGRIQRFSAQGEFETAWTMPEIAKGKPVGLAVHPDGRLFVADTHYHRVLIFDRDGIPLGGFGEEGTGDGQFQLPTDVAFGGDGTIYVGEYHLNDRVTRWSAEFKFLGVIGANPVEGSRLSRPSGLVVDDENTLWVADSCNHRLVRFSPEGSILGVFGQFGSAQGEMRYPYDITFLPDGRLVVCEYEGARLQWFSKSGQSLRIWGKQGRAPGELFAPWSVTYGPMGRLYVVDALNSRVQMVQP